MQIRDIVWWVAVVAGVAACLLAVMGRDYLSAALMAACVGGLLLGGK